MLECLTLKTDFHSLASNSEWQHWLLPCSFCFYCFSVLPFGIFVLCFVMQNKTGLDHVWEKPGILHIVSSVDSKH